MGEPLGNWREEMQAIFLYRVMANAEAGTRREALFNDLAAAAEKQAAIWAGAIEPPLPEFRPSLRVRVAAALIRRFGPRRVRHVLSALKVRGLSVYLGNATGHEMPASVEDVGARHRTGGSGNLRAMVFGVNDGLVSNASLILGVAGAAAEPRIILLSGVAGLLAGAFSMAAGEYISVRSQREVYEYQIGLERDELAKYPQEEAAELALIYTARGIPEADARKLSEKLIADPKVALDTLARDELGLNPNELGSPIGAALFSFISFALGAMVPLAPFLFLVGTPALLLSVGLAAGSLFGVGAALSLFTGKNAILSGLRMLLIGSVAGGATYGIGYVLGVTMT